MDWNLEVVTVPVADADAAKGFYVDRLGFTLDVDHVNGSFRVLQVTPPGSGCSLSVQAVPPGEPVVRLPGLQLVVDDVDAARAELVARGVDAGPVVHFDGSGFVEGRGDRWNSFVFFDDLDGHSWGVQERPRETPLPDPWEAELAAAWATLDALDDDQPDLDDAEAAFRLRIDRLAERQPYDDGTGTFERAAAFDSTGHSDRAVPLYEEALVQGLTGIRRRRATIQLASSLRNLGRAAESVDLLTAELGAGSDELDDAVRGFLALALVDVGRAPEAAALALGALAPHLPRYQRSLAAYAREVT